MRRWLPSTSEEALRKSRFSDEQIVRIFREADREPVAEIAKRHAVSEQTLYTWRKRFGQMGGEDVKRLRELAQENARLRKMLVDRDLELDVIKEIQRKKW